LGDKNIAIRFRLAQLLIFIVLAINLQCALVFLLAPSWFAPGYELNGEVGDAVIRAFGILFWMWNVPYLFAAWNPQRYRLSLWQAILMQTIGLIGETGILLSLSSDHPILRESIFRFIVFDGAGLVALIVALFISGAVGFNREASRAEREILSGTKVKSKDCA
jgi:hypothetical protein